MTQKKLKFRPYARLLTMLGDQLIKNERIALVEIIKNSYDADASWVKVTFEGFDPDFGANSTSRIIIEDDGIGMTESIIEDHWVNPATPLKFIGKQGSPVTKKGRVIQGEKGIGRFALLKLGRKIEISTRAVRQKSEQSLTLDVSSYDENFLGKTESALFLDDIGITLSSTETPAYIKPAQISIGTRRVTRANHGTRIQISALASAWSRAKVAKVYEDLTRLQSIFVGNEAVGSDNLTDRESSDEFVVSIFRDEEYQPFSVAHKEKLENIIENQTVLKVVGGFDQERLQFDFELDGVPTVLSLKDAELSGMTAFRNYFGKDGGVLEQRGVNCGPFSFAFYVFDFSNDAKGRYELDGEQKKLIKEHRIYLYRDGIRVYPYGDPEDDWLQIDVTRGTIRASEFLSNDQVVGYVNITQKANPDLKDKTSREGLIDTGYATADFVALLRLILAWVRKGPFELYRKKSSVVREVEVFKKEQVQTALDVAAVSALAAPQKVQQDIATAAKLYKAERKYLVQRAETTEHLAGVGLSVETASHDLMVAMHRTLAVVDSLISESQRPGELDKEIVVRDLSMVRGTLSFIQAQMKDLQLLFKSTKQRRKDIRVSDVLDKVVRLFQSALDAAKIDLEIDETATPLVAKTTDAVLLQLFLNLFDNAAYWLESKIGERKILISMDGEEGTLIFSDNGPGIKSDDVPYIFDPFFSGKGQDGRGLGLYIARQLLERHEYSIEYCDLKSQRLLSGANFLVSFVKEEE
ncbi:sensor histidine kinase [Massilia sp. CF038]|uniref:sensor histidine kinase n=1 Tax=Massilia sp. CF038 TaxID=1881045 RepID=UPI00091151A4|nr:sensor histidine kinase [Massilia sp. CF038]SHH10364.1 Signal transduction histidine kinase [Massilia sp. CF038]